tara:strand:- start:1206 stop:1520 length:315 start_codon:yes stop_codon:yes gene_type:complete
MNLDHIAIKSDNIRDSIEWYSKNLDAEIVYEDETWGMVTVQGAKIAFVLETMHPPHLCFEVSKDKKDQLELEYEPFKYHRDGSSYLYIKDTAGNTIEYLVWPEN